MRPSRLLAAAVIGPLTGGILALIPAPAQAQQQDPSAAAEAQLKGQSDGKVTVRRDDRGVVRFVGAEPGKPVHRPVGVAATDSPARQAAGYLQRYGALWALDAPGSDARATRSSKAGKGSVVRFQQTVDGMPVLGGELAVALDSDGDLQSVSGETTPLALSVGSRPITEAQAQQTARALAARVHDVPASALTASTPQAYAYDAALLGPAAKNAGLAPVWRVEVTGPANVRHLVLVDRTRGSVVLQFNQVSNALDRMVCDRENQRDTTTGGNPTLATCTVQGGTTDRAEGGAPSANADVNAAYDYTGDTAAYYQSEVGIDLTDMIGYGSTKRLRSTVRYCLPSSFDPQCPMQNAFWNGNGVYYGLGMPKADDIVAHELTHGVIEQTANLFYWYQSGAINESMADVYGELVDLNNADAETETPWELGDGSPFPGGGVIRDMEQPGLFGQPDRMTSSSYHAEPYNSDFFDNGGVHVNSGVGNKAAFLIARPASDGPVTFNGQTITGIGHAKAADVYFQSLQLLSSGADYEDLYSVLPQACQNLVGVGGITAGDCATVTAAVQATEMNQQPPVGKAPEAPVCSDGTKQNLFTDGFEGSLSNWSLTSGMWHHYDGYAKTGTKSLYGFEPVTALGDPRTSTARLARNFTIPSGVKTYLRFDHQFLLLYDIDPATYYDGALLTYSTDGGKTFASAATLPWVNGPTKKITPWNGNGFGTPYTGFGGDSHGYMSSRVDVSSLAGKSVQFRWRITGDTEYSLDGWTLDNVNLYLCGGATPSNATGVGAVGGYAQATVKWQPPVWPGSSPITKYQVLVYQSGTLVKTIDDVSPSATSQLVTGLSHGRTYTFYVKPHNAAGAGPISGKKLIGTVQPSTLSPTTIFKGSSTKFSGKLLREDIDAGLRGLKVYLQYRSKGSSAAFVDLTTATTGTGGAYSFTRRPSSSTEYRVVYKSGGTTYMGSPTAIRTVTVRS